MRTVYVIVLCAILFLLVFLSLSLPAHAQDFDLHKLARAVAAAETSGCTKGVGLSKRNCFGITGGNGYRTFATTQESYTAFEEMYPRVYGLRFPTTADARRYTGNPDPSGWLRIVRGVYTR